MANPTEANPALGALIPLYDPGSGRTNIAWEVDPTTVTQDPNTGVVYAQAKVSATGATGAVGTVVLNQASAAQTANGTSADLYVGNLREIAVDINLSAVAGTTPQIVFSVQRKGADGIYYTLWTSAAQTAAGAISTSIGLGGPVNHSVGQNIRLAWTITGTTPSLTFSASITGK